MAAGRLFAAGALALTIASAAHAVPVSAYLAQADAARAKGFAALFSSDIKRLRDQALSDLMQLRSERNAAKAAGRTPAFCSPEGGVKLTDKDVMDAMQAVPPAAREQTDTKDAWRSYMARRFPCRT